MRDPHLIILKPHISEKSMRLSYGDPRIQNEKDIVRSYTFLVAPDANKIEIKAAVEAIYNEGKKKGDAISVTSVRTITLPGKTVRRRTRASAYPVAGKSASKKKAIVTLAKGQLLEDYTV